MSGNELTRRSLLGAVTAAAAGSAPVPEITAETSYLLNLILPSFKPNEALPTSQLIGAVFNFSTLSEPMLRQLLSGWAFFQDVGKHAKEQSDVSHLERYAEKVLRNWLVSRHELAQARALLFGDNPHGRKVKEILEDYDKAQCTRSPEFLKAMADMILTMRPGEHYWRGYLRRADATESDLRIRDEAEQSERQSLEARARQYLASGLSPEEAENFYRDAYRYCDSTHRGEFSKNWDDCDKIRERGVEAAKGEVLVKHKISEPQLDMLHKMQLALREPYRDPLNPAKLEDNFHHYLEALNQQMQTTFPRLSIAGDQFPSIPGKIFSRLVTPVASQLPQIDAPSAPTLDCAPKWEIISPARAVSSPRPPSPPPRQLQLPASQAETGTTSDATWRDRVRTLEARIAQLEKDNWPPRNDIY